MAVPEFYHLGEANGYICLKVLAEETFSDISTRLEQTAIQQSHKINPLQIPFARTVRATMAFGFYRKVLGI